MRKIARTTAERGISTLELTMAMPLVVFAMLMLIGLGHALISKQHTMVGGQFAAHHQRVREAAPNAAAIGRAVSGGAETFRLSGGGNETLSFTASATPRKGLIAQTFPLRATTSQYQTPRVDNACVPHCKPFDAFARILSPELITGIIFSGNSSSLSKDDLLSIVGGAGKKKRRQKPDGAVAISPGKTNANGDLANSKPPAANGPAPASGSGVVPPPVKPPRSTAGGAADDGNSGNGGNGNGGNGKPGDKANAGIGIPGKPRKKGQIDESERKFTQKEKKLAEYLEAEGDDVKALPEDHSAPGRKTDAVINGKRTEFKGLDPGASDSTVRNSVNNSIRRGGQAREIVIDARGSGLSEEAAIKGLGRAKGISRGRVDSVRIVGDGYDITSTDFN